MAKLNYEGAMADFAEIERVVGLQLREGLVRAVKRVVRERDDARTALRGWEAWDAEYLGGVRAYVAALEADQRRLVVAEQDAAQVRCELEATRRAMKRITDHGSSWQ